jgi:hypothetical protein
MESSFFDKILPSRHILHMILYRIVMKDARVFSKTGGELLNNKPFFYFLAGRSLEMFSNAQPYRRKMEFYGFFRNKMRCCGKITCSLSRNRRSLRMM